MLWYDTFISTHAYCLSENNIASLVTWHISGVHSFHIARSFPEICAARDLLGGAGRSVVC